MPLDPTQEETQLVGQHFAYLKQALADGRLILAGRTGTAPFLGIAIFEAEDEAAALRFTQADPAVKGGVFVATVQPFSVALMASS